MDYEVQCPYCGEMWIPRKLNNNAKWHTCPEAQQAKINRTKECKRNFDQHRHRSATEGLPPPTRHCKRCGVETYNYRHCPECFSFLSKRYGYVDHVLGQPLY